MPSLNRKPSTTRFAGMPSRSNSTDSYPMPPKTHHHHHHQFDPAEPDFASLPPNAFNIMHAWELESLEKWQARLEQVRKDQKVLKARIDALRQDEEHLWAENARAARKPPTTQPQRKRSTASFTSSESEAEYESALPRRTSNGNLRQQYHPNGPSYYQQRTRPVEEYGTRIGNLYAELAALQDQLATCTDTEDKAKRGIQKATTRLERLRSLEERWKVPSPDNSPPLSRSVSPTPGGSPKEKEQQQQQPQQSSRPSSRSPPTSRRNSNDAAGGTSSANPRHSGPTRTASFTFEFRRGSTATFTSNGNASTKTRGTESSKTSTQYTYAKQPLQPSSQASSIDPWLAYEDMWHQLSTNSSGAGISLRFSSIPWPMAVQPSSPDKITTQAIREFLLSPKAIRASAAKINTSGSNDQVKNAKDEAKARRALLRAALLRWHPDKFLSKFLGWVDEREKAAVKEGVGKVVCCKFSDHLAIPLLGNPRAHFLDLSLCL